VKFNLYLLVIFETVCNLRLPRHAGTFETFHPEFHRKIFWDGSRSIFFKGLLVPSMILVCTKNLGSNFNALETMETWSEKSNYLENW
jgi:hypothetical protein